MAYIDKYGDEWISEEVYKKYLKNCSHQYHSVPNALLEREQSYNIRTNILCELCKKRKAVTRSHLGDCVCQNCQLEVIEGYK